ncbi:MAG: cytochrome c [Chitinimonas sp.]|nr:cytochrome c [Chitinimonas sp.]
MTTPLLRTALLACGLAGLALPAGAGSVDIGRTRYLENCLVCHGMPPDQLSNPSVLAGTDAPANIRHAINTQVQMRHLAPLTDTDLANIATFLGKPSTTDADRTFDWGETAYPELLAPAKAKSAVYDGYYYRYYSTTNVYIGIKNGRLYFLDGNVPGEPLDLAPADYYLGQAEAAGF